MAGSNASIVGPMDTADAAGEVTLDVALSSDITLVEAYKVTASGAVTVSADQRKRY